MARRYRTWRSLLDVFEGNITDKIDPGPWLLSPSIGIPAHHAPAPGRTAVMISMRLKVQQWSTDLFKRSPISLLIEDAWRSLLDVWEKHHWQDRPGPVAPLFRSGSPQIARPRLIELRWWFPCGWRFSNDQQTYVEVVANSIANINIRYVRVKIKYWTEESTFYTTSHSSK